MSDDGVYEEDELEDELADDEVSPDEEAFMRGYDSDYREDDVDEEDEIDKAFE